MTVVQFQDVTLANYNKHDCCFKTKTLTDVRNADFLKNLEFLRNI